MPPECSVSRSVSLPFRDVPVRCRSFPWIWRFRYRGERSCIRRSQPYPISERNGTGKVEVPSVGSHSSRSSNYPWTSTWSLHQAYPWYCTTWRALRSMRPGGRLREPGTSVLRTLRRRDASTVPSTGAFSEVRNCTVALHWLWLRVAYALYDYWAATLSMHALVLLPMYAQRPTWNGTVAATHA